MQKQAINVTQKTHVWSGSGSQGMQVSEAQRGEVLLWINFSWAGGWAAGVIE